MVPNTQTQIRSARTSAGSLPAFLVRFGRRALPSSIVFVAWLLLRSILIRSAASLQNEAFVTGYSLAAICVLLVLMGVRKRIVSVPMGRMAIWQQTHHYLGLFSVGAYAGRY